MFQVLGPVGNKSSKNQTSWGEVSQRVGAAALDVLAAGAARLARTIEYQVSSRVGSLSFSLCCQDCFWQIAFKVIVDTFEVPAAQGFDGDPCYVWESIPCSGAEPAAIFHFSANYYPWSSCEWWVRLLHWNLPFTFHLQSYQNKIVFQLQTRHGWGEWCCAHWYYASGWAFSQGYRSWPLGPDPCLQTLCFFDCVSTSRLCLWLCFYEEFYLWFFGPRKATLQGRHGKPTVVVDNNWVIWLGNESADQLTIQGGAELFGFNTGVFDFKICERKLDPSGIPFRLLTDFSMVAVPGSERGSRTLVPLCRHLHTLATQHGLGEIQLREHQLTPKLHAVPGQIVVSFDCCHDSAFVMHAERGTICVTKLRWKQMVLSLFQCPFVMTCPRLCRSEPWCFAPMPCRVRLKPRIWVLFGPGITRRSLPPRWWTSFGRPADTIISCKVPNRVLQVFLGFF